MNNKIYSPILKSAQEAFVYSGDYPIYFTFPQLVDKSAIKHMQVRITRQQDNKTIVSTSQFPDGVYYTKNFSADGVITLPFTTGVITPPRVGEIYKVQLRFGYCDLFNSLKEFTTWKTTAVQNGDFSEWSTIMAIKCISAPEMQFLGFEEGDILNTLRPELAALTQFSAQDEEFVDNYKFRILNSDKQLIVESDWCQHLETEEGIDRYTFDIVLQEDRIYYAEYLIISNNGYQSKIISNFEVSDNYFTELRGVDFTIDELDIENGGIKLLVSANPDNIIGKYVISRADETSNFLKWEDLHVFFGAGVKSYAFTDYTVRDGISYKYALQLINTYGNRTAPLYANKDDPAQIYLEYSYLVGKDGRQLKLQYNFQLSSFKHTVLASKQDTLGSQYPTILRNGVAYYAEFPISGLISVKMDDINSFAQLDSKIAPNELTYENINIEHKFREQVEQFLNDGEPKLFRSATEGNILVVLMEVSLTPQAPLGRALYNFSATAYEVAPLDFKTLREFGIITSEGNIPEDEQGDEIVTGVLGETIEGPISTTFELMSWLNQKLKNEYSSDNYDVELLYVKNIDVLAGDQSAELTVNAGKTITIPAYKHYAYLDEVNYPGTIKVNAPSKLAQLNYTYDYRIMPKPAIDVKKYGRKKTWGQINGESLPAETKKVERLILEDLVKPGALVPGGIITENLTITKDKFEYKINSFYELIISGAPNQNLGTIVLNETGYYRLGDVGSEDLANISINTGAAFTIDYSCTVDWVEKG